MKALGFLVLASAPAWALSLKEYLSQVEKQNQGLIAAQKSSEGFRLRSVEGSLIYSPTLCASTKWVSDEKPTSNPTFQGTKSTLTAHELCIQQVTPFGLNAKLSYNLTHYDVSGASPLFVTEPKFFEASPRLELSQSLWRNFLGSETRAAAEAQESGLKGSSYLKSFERRMLLAQAENTYWRLSLAKQIVKKQQDNLERAKKIRDWAERRSKNNLSDGSDFFQANAGYKLRLLELQSAKQEEASALRAFELQRGNDIESSQSQLGESSLESVEAHDLLKLSSEVTEFHIRDDLKASEAGMKAAEANARLVKNRHRPTLEVFGSYAFNGRDTEYSPTLSESWGNSYPTKAIGLRFSTPLDFWSLSKAVSGANLEEQAARLSFQRRQLESRSEFSDLKTKINDAKTRLQLALEVEELQQEKLNFERRRFQRGRTSTYQVLLFEQDYVNAQLALLRTQGEFLALLTQLKTYQSEAAL